MGILAKYIDSLPDYKKDRIIEAPEFWYSGKSEDGSMNRAMFSGRGCGCLIDTAERYAGAFLATGDKTGKLAARFDELCKYFGYNRIVAACKARASKPSISKLLHQPHETLALAGSKQ